jgi:hypothetical protein
MGFKGNRIFVIIFAIVIIVIVGIALASNSGSGTSKTIKGMTTVTINAEVGIDQIRLVVLNTGATIKLTQFDLPYSFNCSTGNTIQLYATTTSNYVFNTWRFNDGTFSDGEPQTHILALKIDKPIIITADMLYNPQPTIFE